MFASLIEKLAAWFERSEERQLTDYFSSSSDIGELERRMRSVERTSYPE